MEIFYKRGVLKNFAKFTRKLLCQSLFLSEFCEILKKIAFTEHLWVTTSVYEVIILQCKGMSIARNHSFSMLVKFTVKLTFFSHLRMRIRGEEMLVFQRMN